MWDEAWPINQDVADHPAEEPDLGGELEPFPGVAGTTDYIQSIRDAEPYTPPSDPPVLPGGDEGIHVATGFGESPLEENVSDPVGRKDEDLRELAILTLQQDSLASHYNFAVDVDDGVVRLRGYVQSVDDAEHASALVGEIPGVVDVVDDTTVEPSLTS